MDTATQNNKSRVQRSYSGRKITTFFATAKFTSTGSNESALKNSMSVNTLYSRHTATRWRHANLSQPEQFKESFIQINLDK